MLSLLTGYAGAFNRRHRRVGHLTLTGSRVCRHVGIPPAHLQGGSRRAPVSRDRDGIAYLWTKVCGHPKRPLAPVLGVRPQAAHQALARGGHERVK